MASFHKVIHHHLHPREEPIFLSRHSLPSSSPASRSLSCRVLPPTRHPMCLLQQSCSRSCNRSSIPLVPSVSRPVVILPGFGSNSNDYVDLIFSLEERGLAATVTEVSRTDWLINAKGFLDRKCWSGKLSPRPLLDWYFERMNKAIIAAKEAAGGDVKVSLLAHSAGGWLARVYMLEYGIDDIAMLLSLGTPHLPPPKGVPGVIDQTRGLLDYLNKACPGDCFAPDIKYVCVASRYLFVQMPSFLCKEGVCVIGFLVTITRFLKGERIFPSKLPTIRTTRLGTVVAMDKQQVSNIASLQRLDGKTKQWVKTLQACLVGQSYKQVCGQADVWGDGVVPELSAHLHGARNITLDGVYHSMLGARDPDRPWYGSLGILEQWVHYLK